jgi:hypothetical protein
VAGWEIPIKMEDSMEKSWNQMVDFPERNV